MTLFLYVYMKFCCRVGPLAFQAVSDLLTLSFILGVLCPHVAICHPKHLSVKYWGKFLGVHYPQLLKGAIWCGELKTIYGHLSSSLFG